MAPLVDCMIALIIGRDLAERHSQWRAERDQVYYRTARSDSDSRPLPITFHAAKHKRTLDLLTRGSRSPRSPSSTFPPVAPASSTPSPQSLCTEAQILMPERHFLNVHSHYPEVPPIHIATDTVEVVEVMQSYRFSPINTTRRIGFNPQQGCRGLRRPARKLSDLETLPPLNSRTAGEIKSRRNVLEQAARFAEIRKTKEAELEVRRRASTAQQHPMPPFVFRVGKWHRSQSGAHSGLSTTQMTPPVTVPALKQRTQIQVSDPEEEESHGVGGNPARQPHVRWARNLIQQKQKEFQSVQSQHRSPQSQLDARVHRPPKGVRL